MQCRLHRDMSDDASMTTPLANRLMQARKRAGFENATDAATAFGWSPPTYLSHENGSRNPKQEAVERYAAAFRVSLPWLLLGDGAPISTEQPMAEGPSTARRAPFEPPRRSVNNRDIPVIGVAACGSDGAFQMNGEVVDRVQRPPALVNVGRAFAIFVVGTSMEPRYHEGDLLFVNPTRPPAIGDDVLIELHGAHGEPGPSYVKTLERRTAGSILCRQYNPDQVVAYDTGLIRNMFRIMRNNDLYGV